MERPGFFACTRSFVMAATVVMAVAGCTSSSDLGSRGAAEAGRNRGVNRMLEEIHASRKPVGFEQLDVSDIVSRYLPAGTPRADVLAAIREHPGTRIIEESPATMIVRDDTGKAMLDPDVRSVVMTFTFDGAGKLAQVHAVQLKHQ
ncbi:DUF6393 family protein [Stenotrophomonas sp.]|uniref:DUF6393 family protein n=1 Tax=Stenotrophomonas sp. TaxID=69392 RepID=UPI0031D4D1B0